MRSLFVVSIIALLVMMVTTTVTFDGDGRWDKIEILLWVLFHIVLVVGAFSCIWEGIRCIKELNRLLKEDRDERLSTFH